MDWIITSSHAIEDVLNIPVMSKKMPGILGTYVLPIDAVFSLRKAKSTTLLDLEKVVTSQLSHTTPNNIKFTHLTIDEDDVNEMELQEEEDEDEDVYDENEEDEEPVEEMHEPEWNTDDDEDVTPMMLKDASK